MDYVRNLRLGNAIPYFLSGFLTSKPVGTLLMWGSWVPQEAGLRRSTRHSRHRLYLKSFTSSEQKCLTQTSEEMSSSPLEECRHVQISFNELGKDDSGFCHGAHSFYQHSRTY